MFICLACTAAPRLVTIISQLEMESGNRQQGRKWTPREFELMAGIFSQVEVLWSLPGQFSFSGSVCRFLV